MKRATKAWNNAAKGSVYFNPRPREEGDSYRKDAALTNRISIHALVKRATRFISERKVIRFISIHALVKRATRGIFIFPFSHFISIHALVKRATYNLHSL